MLSNLGHIPEQRPCHEAFALLKDITYRGVSSRLEVITKLHQRKACGIPEFVAELAVALNTKDIKVDVPACGIGNI
ncbi:hypothetical protein BC936DRAFT_142846 [Jimgerdemannia flammicorona]|uniref:Uncharacterized protein n=1 Tax=Jimgerdemannia flammicorona TaxID=994334 RepID=A0A433DEP6_9FUNG|nr:hypothetical protein BC936DRAFT_142846 [Jimgerdemannia flammicorona]